LGVGGKEMRIAGRPPPTSRAVDSGWDKALDICVGVQLVAE